jgi:hypothetical protein
VFSSETLYTRKINMMHNIGSGQGLLLGSSEHGNGPSWIPSRREISLENLCNFKLLNKKYRDIFKDSKLALLESCIPLRINFSTPSMLYSILLPLYSPLLGLGRSFKFLIYTQSVRTHWKRDQPVARSLPTHRTTQTQNKHTQTSMTRVGFKPKTPVFERAKTVHAF